MPGQERSRPTFVIAITLLCGAAACVWLWALADDSMKVTKASAVATFVAAVVAAVYGWFTYGLWEETVAQTQQTATQTQMNREMFVSENRPYVAVRYDMPFVQNSSDYRTALSCRVYLKNAGRSPANVMLCWVEGFFRGQSIGSLNAGGLVLLPGEEQMIAGLVDFDGNPLDRYNQPDPMSLNARVEYMMDTGPASPVRYITTSIIEVTQAGQFLTHQVLTSEPVPRAT
jgi:hypothetical protein